MDRAVDKSKLEPYQGCPVCGKVAVNLRDHTINEARKRLITAMEDCVKWARNFDLEVDDVVSNLIVEYDTAKRRLDELVQR